MTDPSNINAGVARLPAASRQLRLGIVGGGGGGFIGPVHAIAARMDNRYRLVAGALSSRPDIARAAGAEWFLPADRSYTDYRDMARAEAARPDGAEVVAITTPNHSHHAIARAFLDQGIHVICDKPMTTQLADALDLRQKVTETGLGFYVTHGFAAYPMVRQARAMVAAGKLGRIGAMHVEFMGDWLTPSPDEGAMPPAGWRTDPALSGPGGAIADIGTHAFHLARFVSGQEVSGLLAQLSRAHPARRLDDNAHLLLRFEGGATGSLLASQVSPGNDCELRFRIYGDRGGLEWSQADANHLWFTETGQETRRIARGGTGTMPAAQHMTRVPRGHPEGYLEAFANLYSEVALDLIARIDGIRSDTECLAAAIADGVLGVAFVEAAVASDRLGNIWQDPRALI